MVGREVPRKVLSHVQPLFLLQVLVELSQTLNLGAATRPDALARALILDGQERLRRLRKAAPHLDLSWDSILGKIRPTRTLAEGLSDEESAVRAMLEMCIGLMLQWLSEADGQSDSRRSSFVPQLLLALDVPLSIVLSSSHLLFRVRSCLIS